MKYGCKPSYQQRRVLSIHHTHHTGLSNGSLAKGVAKGKLDWSWGGMKGCWIPGQSLAGSRAVDQGSCIKGWLCRTGEVKRLRWKAAVFAHKAGCKGCYKGEDPSASLGPCPPKRLACLLALAAAWSASASSGGRAALATLLAVMFAACSAPACSGGCAALAALTLAVFAAFSAAFCSVERDARSRLLCCTFFALRAACLLRPDLSAEGPAGFLQVQPDEHWFFLSTPV